MEKDIKIVKSLECGDDIELKQAIENLTNRLQDLEQIEAEHQRTNGELREQLEEDYTSVYLKGTYDERDKWESKIRERIEELETERSKFENDNVNRIFIREFIRKYTEKNDPDYGMLNIQEVITYMMNDEYNAEILILQDLLEENK